jgi:hypothetical protein
MSTILNALRKAKQFPQQESVDARHEILSERSHDYLATVPGAPEGQLRFLRIAVLSAAAVILGLTVVIVLLIVSPRRGPEGDLEGNNAGQAGMTAPSPTPSPASAQREETATPAVRRVEIVVATPQPTPVAPKVSPPAPATVDAAPREAPRVGADSGTSPSLEGVSPGAVESIANLRLVGIAWDSTDPMAMINGRAVREGSEIAGGHVRKINRDSVIIIVNGREYTLRP